MAFVKKWFKTKPATSTSNTSNTFDAGIIDAGNQLIADAQGIQNNPFANAYQNQAQGYWNNVTNPDVSMNNPFMQSYNQLADRGVMDINRQLQSSLMNVQDQSGWGGGGSRNAIAKMMQGEMAARQAGDLRANMNVQGLNAYTNANMNAANAFTQYANQARMFPMQQQAHTAAMLGAVPKNTYGNTTGTQKAGGNPFLQYWAMVNQTAGNVGKAMMGGV